MRVILVFSQTDVINHFLKTPKKHNMKLFQILVLIIFIPCNSQETKCNNDFNLKGRVQNVEETIKYSDYEMKSIYSLNENDYVLSIEVYANNSLFEKTEIKYDKNNITQEIIVVDSKGKEKSKSSFINNNENQIEKTIIKTSNGKSIIVHNYEGNSEFPNSGKESHENGKVTRSWKLKYKNDLVFIQSNFNPDGTIISETTFSYNENNDLVEVIEKDKNSEILNKQYSEYKYDDKKNWVERKLYDTNKNLVSTSIRKIKYW